MTLYTPVDVWVEAVTGFSRDTVEKWAAVFKENGFFEKSEIKQALSAYCSATEEIGRYPTFHVLLSYIQAFVRYHNRDFPYFPIYLEQVALAASRQFAFVEGKQDGNNNLVDLEPLFWSLPAPNYQLKYTGPVIGLLEKRMENDRLSPESSDVEDGDDGEHREDGGVEENAYDAEEESPSPSSAVMRISDSAVSTIPGSRSDMRGKKRPLESNDLTRSGDSSNKKPLDSETWRQRTKIELQEDEAKMEEYALTKVAFTRGTCVYSLGILIRDDKVSYWYFDASGIVRTSPESTLSIIFDLEKVAAIHVAIVHCGPVHFGMFPPSILCPPAHRLYPVSIPVHGLTGYTIDLSGTQDQGVPYKVTLGNHVYSQNGFIGRRTTVYLASSTSGDTGGRALVVKISQQGDRRTSEVELLEHARQCGVKEHVAEIVKAKDLWRLSEGPRKAFIYDQGQQWEDRILRCLLLPYYRPLHDQLRENPDSIKTMATQMLKCLHDLRYDAHILHRDVSENNIMYTVRDGRDHFVLIDFDVAVRVDDEGRPLGPTAHDRIGTLPFMAYELLADMHAAEMRKISGITGTRPMVHCLRWDFQSVALVCLWCAIMLLSKTNSKCKTDVKGASEAKLGGAPGTNPTLNSQVMPTFVQQSEEAARHRDHLRIWQEGTYSTMAKFKRNILEHPKSVYKIPLSPLFVHLAPWFTAFFRPFAEGIAKAEDFAYKTALKRMRGERGKTSRLAQPSFKNYQTAWGTVTYENFMKSFAQYEKDQGLAESEDEEQAEDE